jgi:type IV pilus assembly protein PilM
MKFLDRLKGKEATVGLDIGNHALKLAKISHTKENYFLEAVGIQELPEGTIEGSEIKNKDALIEGISTLINKTDPSIVEVVISMSGHGLLSEKFTFTINPNENEEELILWEAGQRSPFDVDDITLDYKILHRNPQNNEIDVLLVAAKNQIMMNYIDLLYEAGLKPVIVDADTFAVYNCFSLELANRNESGTIALINIGHDLTNVTFIKDTVYHSMRDISLAGDFFARTLQRNLGISKEDAFSIMRKKASGGVDHSRIEQSIQFAAEELSSGIELAISYFRSSEKSDVIDKIVLSGGGAYIPELTQFLEKRFETVVQISNPLAYLDYHPDLFGVTDPRNISALLTIAIGLALRRVSE